MHLPFGSGEKYTLLGIGRISNAALKFELIMGMKSCSVGMLGLGKLSPSKS